MKTRPASVEKETPSDVTSAGRRWRGWIKRLGVVGFIFFFAKGLLWLLLPALLFHFGFGA